ncbi:MAG TPA: c-type cytochrome [Longimicrobiales bacterium]|nr:c-type cytochrome [Longimicrobiales bacterium]
MRTLLFLLLAFAACREPESQPAVRVTAGDAQNGARLIRELGCGGCHTVPGVRGANGLTGPPLTAFAQRAYIAGRVPNEEANLVQWIVSPQSIDPETAMPATGASATDARDIAAYLYTLDRGGLGPPHLLPKSWLDALRTAGPL